LYSNGVPYIAIWVFSQPLNIPVNQFTLNLWQQVIGKGKVHFARSPMSAYGLMGHITCYRLLAKMNGLSNK
jgi:hypothetical protein